MIENLSYNEFCGKYFITANRSADIAVSNFIKKYGVPHQSIDLEVIKDSATEYALEKAFNHFDASKNASIETYLFTIIHNRIITELGKESKAIKAGNPLSLDQNDRLRVKVEGRSDEQESDEDDSMDILEVGKSGSSRAKMISRLQECIKKLSPEDQIILGCWMKSPDTYTDDALKALGWGSEKRASVQGHKKRALDSLRKMLEKKSKTPNTQESTLEPKQAALQYYDLKLKGIKNLVDIIKEYFGLDHPTLDGELMLLGMDPERVFHLPAYVRFEDVMTAFKEAEFLCPEELEYTAVSILCLVANLYYGDSYQRYQEYYSDLIYDELMWEVVEKDILKFYVFMKKHRERGPLSIKIGKAKIDLENTDMWFHNLMDNHLFPKCLPKITTLQEAENKLKKDAGRRSENKVATAIINGISTLFEDLDWIRGRAPKNLCAFIKKFLILMNVFDKNDTVLSEANIKSSITNFRKQKEDPRFFTPESKMMTLAEVMADETLKSVGSFPERDWLFNPEQ